MKTLLAMLAAFASTLGFAVPSFELPKGSHVYCCEGKLEGDCRGRVLAIERAGSGDSYMGLLMLSVDDAAWDEEARLEVFENGARFVFERSGTLTLDGSNGFVRPIPGVMDFWGQKIRMKCEVAETPN